MKPTVDAVADGSYAVSRYLFNYVNGKPKGVAKAFIEFALSPEGQRIAEDVEYIALPEDVRAEELAKLQ
jgi:phosphate transport system substrate-binding protein